MTQLAEAIDLSALNSATKYPSIETHHKLGERGALTEVLGPFADYAGDVILTEKVDGTNGRIILLPDGDYFIGSREELLHARGDRVENPALGIAAALKPLADRLQPRDEHHQITVFFLEVYGHKVGAAAKQYTTEGNVGCRMFDMAFVTPDVLDWYPGTIAAWRDAGGQRFGTEATLKRAAEAEGIELAPRLGAVSAETLPASVEGMYEWLTATLPGTRVALDDKAGGRPEGIVLRSADRSVISKARFEDYERTLKRRNQGKR